jgi:hypothetical protein
MCTFKSPSFSLLINGWAGIRPAPQRGAPTDPSPQIGSWDAACAEAAHQEEETMTILDGCRSLLRQRVSEWGGYGNNEIFLISD